MSSLWKAFRVTRIASQVTYLRKYLAQQKLLTLSKGVHMQPSVSTQTSSLEAGDDLHLSDSCIRRLKEIQDGVGHLRVIVEGGGCSGFQYKFELDSKVTEDDRVFEKDGVKVVIDKDSLDLVKGSTVDFYHEMIRSSFRIINNPKAEQGCSCGASFSVKL